MTHCVVWLTVQRGAVRCWDSTTPFQQGGGHCQLVDSKERKQLEPRDRAEWRPGGEETIGHHRKSGADSIEVRQYISGADTLSSGQ